MNGIHDMGGMEGMGPLPIETEEPVFHHRWEGRAFALVRAMGAFGRWNIDASRYARERIEAARYLRMSYFERWIEALGTLLIEHGLLSATELERLTADPRSTKHAPALLAAQVPALLARGAPASRDCPEPPRFAVGERVRARNLHPAGHTRLPRYVRGRVGRIECRRGAFVFPDSNALLKGEQPHPLYSVRFEAQELWGDRAGPREAVYLDLWERYLERP